MAAALPHDTLTIAYQTLKYHSLDRSVDFHPCDNHKSLAVKFEFNLHFWGDVMAPTSLQMFLCCESAVFPILTGAVYGSAVTLISIRFINIF